MSRPPRRRHAIRAAMGLSQAERCQLIPNAGILWRPEREWRSRGHPRSVVESEIWLRGARPPASQPALVRVASGVFALWAGPRDDGHDRHAIETSADDSPKQGGLPCTRGVVSLRSCAHVLAPAIGQADP
jgi:hypothetical protein